MASKCIKKLMVVVESLILILLKVQANYHAHISFRPSPPPVLLPHFSELDKTYSNDLASTYLSPSSLPIPYPQYSFKLDEVKKKWRKCIPDLIESCEEKNLPSKYLFEICIIEGHWTCVRVNGLRHTKTSYQCIADCINNRSARVALAPCYLECCDKHFKEHSK
jgi:hypothetical protein